MGITVENLRTKIVYTLVGCVAIAARFIQNPRDPIFYDEVSPVLKNARRDIRMISEEVHKSGVNKTALLEFLSETRDKVNKLLQPREFPMTEEQHNLTKRFLEELDSLEIIITEK